MPKIAPEMALTVAVVGQHHFRQQRGAGLEVRNAEDSIIQTAPAGRDSWQKVGVSRPPAAPVEFFRIGWSQKYYFLPNHRP